LRHRGHAAAHLRVDDDPDDPDNDHPEELEAEGGAGLRVEDEVADVDEAADRREDPERDREEVLHAHASAFAFRSSSRARRCCSVLEAWPRCFNSLLTLVAPLAVRLSFVRSAGVVFALCSDLADCEAAFCRDSEWIRVYTDILRT